MRRLTVVSVVTILALLCAATLASAAGAASVAAQPVVTAPAPASATGAAAAQDGHIDVVAHHVRYRRSLFNWKESPGFGFWKNADAREPSRERMWIAEVWRPQAGQVRNVVFVAAGQQGTRFDWSAVANVATGQSKGWRGAKGDVTHAVPIRELSVAGLIYEDGVANGGRLYGFSPADTLFVLVFDAAFYYGLDEGASRKLEHGYYDYLLDRIGPSQAAVQSVVMIGSSRGGALACRLAKRFLAAGSPVQNARVLVATLDAVANPGQGECGTSTATVVNPLNSSYRAYKAALSGYFGDAAPVRLGMFQVVGGAKVVPLQFLDPARGFINTGTPSFDYSSSWVDRTHTEIGRVWHDDCAGALLQWLASRHGLPTTTAP